MHKIKEESFKIKEEPSTSDDADEYNFKTYDDEGTRKIRNNARINKSFVYLIDYFILQLVVCIFMLLT